MTAIFVMAGLYVLLLSFRSAELTRVPVQEYLLTLLLAASIIVTDRFPIHLLRGTKLSLVTLPLFLATALLSAPFAIVTTGLGLVVANLLARVERGMLPRDIASTVGQWMLTVFWGSQLLHADLFEFSGRVSRLELLLLCALSFLLIDFVVFAITQASICGEPFLGTLKSVIKQGFSFEVIQYLIAVLGILAADKDIGSLILLIVPITITFVAFKNIKETRYETI